MMMLGENEYNIQTLFEQLGLDSSPEAIGKFISENPLAKDERLIDAAVWTENQRKFLTDAWEQDAQWSEAVDELNVRMHPDD